MVERCCAPAAEPLSEREVGELAATFKLLADPVRLRLLALIAARAGGGVCVCELSVCFELTQPTISHHLRALRQAGVIDCERRGTWVYYWAVPGALEQARRAVDLLSAPAAHF